MKMNTIRTMMKMGMMKFKIVMIEMMRLNLIMKNFNYKKDEDEET